MHSSSCAFAASTCARYHPPTTTRVPTTRASTPLRAAATPFAAIEEEVMSEEGPSVLVIGAGRVGTYLACKFANAGGRVILKGAKPAEAGSGTSDDGQCGTRNQSDTGVGVTHPHRVGTFTLSTHPW